MVRSTGFGQSTQDLVIRRTLRFLLVFHSFNIAQLKRELFAAAENELFHKGFPIESRPVTEPQAI